MKLAGDFLSKFQNLTPPDEAVRSLLVKTIQAITGIPVSKKNVSLSRGTAFIDCSSVAKSLLRVHRGEVLKELYLELPKARETVRDIR
jgi:hypothetical protein